MHILKMILTHISALKIFHQHIVALSCQYPTFLHNSISLCPINLLSPDDVTGGISKVNELALSMEVQSSGVHQILYGDHVLIWHLGIHVHAPDDPWTTFTIHQEKFMLRFCSKKNRKQRQNTISLT